MKLEFIEDSHSGYSHRTFENARLSDATIAFALDFETSGEKMTKEAAEKYNKIYIQIPMFDLSKKDELKTFYPKIKEISEILKSNDCHILNIAGNGASRFKKYKYTQHKCDSLIEATIVQMIMNGVHVSLIRSGGQTGADESGIKAAINCGIDCVCLCPKGWRFRTATEDISDEKRFKERFE